MTIGLSRSFWKGRRVFLTGHTGFKGSWLALMLSRLGAQVFGYALAPPSTPNLFDLAEIGQCLRDRRADILDMNTLRSAMAEALPDIVIHLAAQSLVRRGYADPIATFQVNVLGTAHLLQACRGISSLRAVLIVTTDKCYDNQEWVWGYRETDRLGGRDPYSSSKACAELVTSAFRDSYLAAEHIAVVSARAGNVVGGGDFAADRIVPDAVRACVAGQVLQVRHPAAIRPWQHVLDPLYGYLLLLERAYSHPATYAEAWNFGPDQTGHHDVRAIVDRFMTLWGSGAAWREDTTPSQHEAGLLTLDASKARGELGWKPTLDFETMLAWTAEWYLAYAAGGRLQALTLAQIDRYFQSLPWRPA